VADRRGLPDDPRLARVLDGEPERGTADAVDDDIELTGEMLGDSRGAEAEGTGGLLRDRDQPEGTLPAGAAVEAA
jgi:hypothetical protein